MKITCISDLHGFYPDLNGGDLLIVAGDLTAQDAVSCYVEFFDWLEAQKYRKKIFIGGNHDNFLEDCFSDQQANEFEGFEYLCDSGTTFEGLKIWGSPWTSKFPGINPLCCAFTRNPIVSLKDRWDLIPDDVDILITHSPPQGIFDLVYRYDQHVGNVDLKQALDRRLKPKLHVFGHIHAHGGKKMVYKRPGYGEENNTIFANCSIMDEVYDPVHQPIEIIL